MRYLSLKVSNGHKVKWTYLALDSQHDLKAHAHDIEYKIINLNNFYPFLL